MILPLFIIEIICKISNRNKIISEIIYPKTDIKNFINMSLILWEI